MPNNIAAPTAPIHHFTFHAPVDETRERFTAGCHQCNFSFTGPWLESSNIRLDHELAHADEVHAFWAKH